MGQGGSAFQHFLKQMSESRGPKPVEMMQRKNKVVGGFDVLVDGKHFDENR
jgi:hypothetical protein